MSNLETLIRRNVAGKNGGVAFCREGRSRSSRRAAQGKPVAFSDEEIIRRMACPRTGEPLVHAGNALRVAESGDAYPVYKGLPLLVEAYARIWQEQNAGRGDPATWPEFSC